MLENQPVEKDGEGNKTVDQYVELLDNTINNKNSREKSELLKMTQKYVLENSYAIQKYIENVDVKDKIKIVAKLRRFKEEEIEAKVKSEKAYTSNIITLAIIVFIGMALLGVYNKNQILIIVAIIAIIVITGVLITIEDYVYDISSSKKELKNIDNWLEGLKEEADILKENNFLKQEMQNAASDFDNLKKEYKELQKRNKELEAEALNLKGKIEELELTAKRTNVSRETLKEPKKY